MTVKAYDGTCSDTRDVTVTVTNVDGEGMAPLSSHKPVVGAGLSASLTDADGGITGETRQWARCDGRFDAGRDLYRHRYIQVHDPCPGGSRRRGQGPAGRGHVGRRPRLWQDGGAGVGQHGDRRRPLNRQVRRQQERRD